MLKTTENSINCIAIKLIYSCLLMFFCLSASAQKNKTKEDKYNLGEPITTMKIRLGTCTDIDGETIAHFQLPIIYVFPSIRFKNNRQRMEYTKLVRNVKRTLPLAKMINGVIIETYEYMETIPTKKERQKHMDNVERGLMKQYKPEMKKLTLTQGKLLIKLVDRECDSRAYDLIKAFAGSFKATVYNAFAATFGASLKKDFDPKKSKEDKLIEQICILVENGQI